MSASGGRTSVRWLVGLGMAMTAVLVVAGCARTTQGTAHVPSTSAVVSNSPDFPSRPAPGSSAGAPSSGTSATTTGTPDASRPSASPGWTRAQRERQLSAQTNGEAHTVVRVPRGYEAATYDTAGAIQFWQVGGTEPQWRQVGASRYPAEVTGRPYEVSVTGALLRKMVHATFIVRGQFTTDNSGLAVAYTTGPRGWGTIKAKPDGNIGPSGQPIGSDRIGLSRGFAFVGGRLQTRDCPQNRPIANCAGHEIVKLWVWAGQEFRRTS